MIIEITRIVYWRRTKAQFICRLNCKNYNLLQNFVLHILSTSSKGDYRNKQIVKKKAIYIDLFVNRVKLYKQCSECIQIHLLPVKI